MKPRLLPILGVSFALALAAQNPAPGSAPSGSVDAASIKPNNSGSGHASTNSDKGRITFENVPLYSMIATAYGLHSYQLDAPAWTRDVRFDAMVTFTGIPPGQKFSQTVQLMAPWLASQFKLVLHHESRQLPGYALVVGKHGAKLQPTSDPCCHTSSDGNDKGIQFDSITNMANFALNLSGGALDRPVVIDKTGLQGNFKISMQYVRTALSARDVDQDATPVGPSLFDAIRQLGLDLKPENVPVDVTVVDHAERVPIGN